MDGRTTILPSRRFMCAWCVCAVVHMPTITGVDCWEYYVSREATRRSRCCVQPRWDGAPHAQVVNAIIVVRCADRNSFVLFGTSSDSAAVILLRVIAVNETHPKRILNPNHKTIPMFLQDLWKMPVSSHQQRTQERCPQRQRLKHRQTDSRVERYCGSSGQHFVSSCCSEIRYNWLKPTCHGCRCLRWT